MEPSLARLAFAALVVVAIAFGLFVATRITGVRIPLSGSAPLLPIAEDALFSATATIGYVCLFNVPARLAWGLHAPDSFTPIRACGGPMSIRGGWKIRRGAPRRF